MHILFVAYNTYVACSGVHIHFLASEMTKLGHQCTVCLPHLPEKIDYFGSVNYTLITHNKALKLAQQDFFKDAIIHAWTPREPTRWLVEELHQKYHIPYFIHLEDNEKRLMETYYGNTLFELKKDAKVHPETYTNTEWSHPLRYENYLAKTSGVTCIIKALEEDVPDGIPRMTFWPACEEEFFMLDTHSSNEKENILEIEHGTTVIVYPGTLHNNNKDIIADLVIAIDMLNQERRKIKMVRIGQDHLAFSDEINNIYKRVALSIGDIPAQQLPFYIDFADILVQPGHPDSSYDAYRFPSKIPFFLASGRPVILPKTNIGLALTHGENALLLNTGSPEEIAKYIRLLIDHPYLAANIGKNGRIFARHAFSWRRSALALLDFYQTILKRQKIDF